MCTVYDLAAVTNPTLREIKFPYNGVIVGATGTIQVGGTLGSSIESGAMGIFNKNTSTNTNLITTELFFNSAVGTSTVSGLNVPVQGNVPYVVSVTTPVFSVSPTTVRYSCNIWIRRI